MTLNSPFEVGNVIVVRLTFALAQPSFLLQIKLCNKVLSWVLIELVGV